ncbi:interferon-induced very large GTPase 1-like isoform X2 [Nelusetta ayraudi]
MGSEHTTLASHNEVESTQECGANLMDSLQDNNPPENLDKDPQSEAGVQTSNAKVLPELTLVLIGDTNAIDMGSSNLLLENYEQVSEFSTELYNLCGRVISVTNMLGLQNIESFHLNDTIHAFLLLIPNGLHVSHYSSGLQWLEKNFGKESLDFVMTVVTYKSDEKCENTLTDLKVNGSFEEKRYHTCLRSMTDPGEIQELLEKIDGMASENNPSCYGGSMHHEDKEQINNMDSKYLKDKGVVQQNCAGDQAKSSSNKEEEKCDKPNHPAEESDSTTAFRHKPESTEKGTIKRNIDGREDTCLLTPSEDNSKGQAQETFEMLLTTLQLTDRHQEKWTADDFLKILPPVRQNQDTQEEDVAQKFLQGLMLLDYRARYIPVRQHSPDGPQTNPAPEPENGETEDGDSDLLFDTEDDVDEFRDSHVHPMDVQMAVFHCSDSFLKQIMITKLSQCQFALPLLVPDPVTMNIECPLWTFRQIKKTWKTTESATENTITTKSMPIWKAETPMVSFLRLGSLSLSKSQLINALINDRHSTFFHRECPGSTKSRHLMEGVAEIAWYCPAGKPNEAFTDCTAFCNLHGDAMSLEKQRDILTEKSSIIVVFVPTLKKGNQSSSVITALFNSKKPLICLIVDEKCNARQMKKGKYKMGLKERNQADIAEELKRIICSILSEQHDSFTLETMAEVPGIRVDEKNDICQKTKCAAEEIQEFLKEKDVSEIKEKFLPCQGELWHKWCSTNKEQYHLVGPIEMEKSKKLEKMKKLRKDQYKASDRQLMTKFIESLQSFKSKDKAYFLKWTQIIIDALPKNDLAPILQEYDKKWTEILTLKKDQKDTDQQEKELDILSKQLQSATFGLEHIFREMGQIYEAHASLENPPLAGVKDWSKYPELAAEVLISGHPMELMDGDAAHVPLMWISSLLDEVVKKLGDKRVFVLSVLGIQSSGKSTMLNAMFGLQFAVSAGRCTKGAFMQLLKVSEGHFDFDYLLVVDTEGLRALELAGNVTLHHDNELATFVVGLGNMTLINIFGENPSDMQDVLQIVVQAFMRMKRVKLSPSCVFVHQNVTDISATERNMEGKRRLQEKLDQMAQLAAKEEVCGAEKFSDIIAFNVQEDVKYFAQLWEGSPPMAPPNPGYSESIQELKNFILSKASQSTGVPLSHFKNKVEDLWKALLNENFVFSFKNSLEIAVYRKLEVKYSDLTWELRNHMLNIENQFYTKIENGQLESVVLNDLYGETKTTFAKIQTDLTSYFEDNRDKEMLSQWRGRFESKVKDFHQEQVKILKNKLDKIIQQKQAFKKVDNERTGFESKLMQKSKELAKQFKGKTDDEDELQKQFDSVWTHWVDELTKDTNPVDDINLENDKTSILLDLGIEYNSIEESKKSGNFKIMSEIGNYFQYVCTKHHGEKGFLQKHWQNAKGHVSNYIKSFSHHEQELIRSFIIDVERESVNTLMCKPVAIKGYNPAYLVEMAKKIKNEVTKFETEQKYALKKEFTVDLLHYVFDRTEHWLLREHNKFQSKNDALTYVQSKKDENYCIFRNFCQGSSSVMVLAALVCERLKASIAEAAFNQSAVNLANEMRCSSPAFNGNRSNLEKFVLKALAEKEEFSSFITYIQQPRRQVETFIKGEVEKYIFEENTDKVRKILKKNVDDMKAFVNKALHDTMEKVQAQSGKTEMWLEEFFSALKEKLTFTMSCQSFSDINNLDFLKEEITTGIESIAEEIRILPLDEMKKYRMKPDEILIEQLCNCCWVTCPFCAAVCSNTLAGHSPYDHSVPFHRSGAVTGRHYRGTDEMSLEFCTTKVSSNMCFYPFGDPDRSVPFKSYRTGGPKYACWRITPDESRLSYWKWFVCRFEKELEKYYGRKFHCKGKIPHEWRNHSKEKAIASLDQEQAARVAP